MLAPRRSPIIVSSFFSPLPTLADFWLNCMARFIYFLPFLRFPYYLSLMLYKDLSSARAERFLITWVNFVESVLENSYWELLFQELGVAARHAYYFSRKDA